MQEINREILIAKAVELLQNGTVDRVLGWQAGEFDYDITPAVFETPEQLKQSFVWGDFCGANFSKYLIQQTQNTASKVLAFLKPCDTYSFNQLLTEHRFDREKVYAVGVSCNGMLDINKIKQKAEGVLSVLSKGDTVTVKTLYDGELELPFTDLLAERCQSCKSKKHVAYDELLGADGITASYGNVVTVESNETVYKKFNQLYFFNYLIYSFFTVSVAVLIQPFIRFWIGGESENFFPYRTVIILLCYFYVYGMRRVVLMTKDTVGLYRPDRFFALIEAAINIVLSLVLVTRFKTIDGLILANLLSMLLIPMWTQPYLVYKHVLKKSVAGYYLRYAVYAALTAAMTVLTLFLTSRFITVQNILLELLLKALVCLVVPNGLNLLIFAKTPEMQDLITMGKSLLKRKRG